MEKPFTNPLALEWLVKADADFVTANRELRPRAPSLLLPIHPDSDIPQRKPTATENPFEKPPTSAVVAGLKLADNLNHAT